MVRSDGSSPTRWIQVPAPDAYRVDGRGLRPWTAPRAATIRISFADGTTSK
jgi:hypothetical protein